MLKTLGPGGFDCCVTSPPYFGLRDYGIPGQLGLEKTPDEYVYKLRTIFSEVRRVLKDDGTLWLNLGDTYAASGRGAGGHGFNHRDEDQKISKVNQRRAPVAGFKMKDLIGIPWRVAFALQADGWYLRQDIIWHKPNPMPESVKDRCTKAHEYIFLFSKKPTYYYDGDAVREPLCENSEVAYRKKLRSDKEYNLKPYSKVPKVFDLNTRNRRSVWTVTTKCFKGAHFATFPPELIEPCILAGCPKGGVVLDPFFGAGTTGVVAESHGRKYCGIELNPEYVKIAQERLYAPA